MRRTIARLGALLLAATCLSGCVGFSLGSSPVQVYHYHFRLVEPAPKTADSVPPPTEPGKDDRQP